MKPNRQKQAVRLCYSGVKQFATMCPAENLKSSSAANEARNIRPSIEIETG